MAVSIFRTQQQPHLTHRFFMKLIRQFATYCTILLMAGATFDAILWLLEKGLLNIKGITLVSNEIEILKEERTGALLAAKVPNPPITQFGGPHENQNGLVLVDPDTNSNPTTESYLDHEKEYDPFDLYGPTYESTPSYEPSLESIMRNQRLHRLELRESFEQVVPLPGTYYRNGNR